MDRPSDQHPTGQSPVAILDLVERLVAMVDEREIVSREEELATIVGAIMSGQ